MLTPHQFGSLLNSFVATSLRPQPLTWSPWPPRSGWLQAELPEGNRSDAYELGKHIREAGVGLNLTVLVAEPGLTGKPWTLIVGRGQLH